MLETTDLLTVGQLAERAGLAPSAVRYYESEGLITAQRTEGGQRRFPRSALRRAAFIRAAQKVGLTLDQIRESLDELPDGRTPNRADWERLSRSWRPILDRRIAELQELRDQLTSCIGCGCLSLKTCALSNPNDEVGREGSGARYLLIGREAETEP